MGIKFNTLNSSMKKIKMKEKNFVSDLHNSSKRDYLQRMVNNKVDCMKVARNLIRTFGMEIGSMDTEVISI